MKFSREEKNIEIIEEDILNQIYFTLSQDLEKMLNGLNSKNKIKNDWINAFNRIDKKKQTSDFARGAERIYFWLFNQFGIPNSAPIGADMFFETYKAYVHIDIKSAKLTNKSDYKGKIPISENQTSYHSRTKKFNTNLPFYYLTDNTKKPCLTYVINVIYDDTDDDFCIKSVYIISIPNGILYNIYKDEIIGQGKTKGKSFRFIYSKAPYYRTMSKNKLRIKKVYIDDDLDEKDIIGFDLNKL
jgi:hypothetical protein